MSKRLNADRIILIVCTLVLIATIAFVAVRYNNPAVGFRYFEPAYMPPNTSIKAKRISIVRSSVAVEQNFRTEDWVYAIREYKDNMSGSMGGAKQDYDPKSVGPTCDIRKSPAGNRYRICHWIDYGRIDVHEVSFIKDGTMIYSQIPTKTDQEISIDQIGKYVDSFHRKSTFGFPVLRSSGA